MGDGLKTATELALEAEPARSLPGSGEQLELGAEPLPDLLGMRQVVGADRRGPGRPAGARNKRTEAWTDYLLSRYSSPLEGLLQLATMGVEDLVTAIGCTRLEALQEKRQAMIAALPYLHQRQAIAVDLTKRSVVHLTINEAPDAEFGDQVALTATVIDNEQNQQLSEGKPDEV